MRELQSYQIFVLSLLIGVTILVVSTTGSESRNRGSGFTKNVGTEADKAAVRADFQSQLKESEDQRAHAAEKGVPESILGVDHW